MSLETVTSLCEAFQETAATHADRVALRTPGDAVSLTWSEYAERVRILAAGLAAQGVGRGDTVALMMLNRPEAVLVDCAALHLGAIPFSVYNTSSPEQLAHLFGNAGNRIVVTQQAFLPTIRACGIELDTVVSVDGVDAGDDGDDGAIGLDELEASGDPAFDFESAWRAVRPEDVLTLIYTSGTTGPPKGVELTHASMLAQLRGTQQVIEVTAEDRSASYLPFAHVADRWATYYGAMVTGCRTTFVDNPQNIIASLGDAKPTVWGGVPRIWEKLKAGLEAKGITDPAALDADTRAAVLALLGLDEVRWSVSGAAPVAVEVLQYFSDLGLPICELWGMSEISCCGSINPPHDNRLGTVGPPIPGVETRLADDGELLFRGPTVMRGYRNQPEKTAEAIDADGWLHTGDIASIDADGYITIVDRKKELIINAAGKNMSPANIEQTVKTAHPLIGQAVVIGDRRPYNVALLVIDPDVRAAYAEQNGLDASPDAFARDPSVRAVLEEAIAQANARLSRVEQIKRFTILPADWLPGGDELTPTMKLKRRPIDAKYAAEIEALYSA
ncbi:MAG TPA: AMP-dependent synthetase/ligase [Nocardioides sp.]|nr:AMP-dependent synthetase/ligase [Nocardioides sp.]